MTRYRISHYDPAHRDAQGRYCGNHWTAVSDMGSPAYEPPLTVDSYLQTEQAYIQAILEVAGDIDGFVVTRAEKAFSLAEVKAQLSTLGIVIAQEEEECFRAFAVGLSLTAEQVPAVAKLILREALWGEIASTDGRMIIEFGYDYYLYLTLPALPAQAISRINATGLFVESDW